MDLVYAEQFRRWAGQFVGNEKVTLSNYFQFIAGYWSDLASMYGQNSVIIGNVISQKVQNGEK